MNFFHVIPVEASTSAPSVDALFYGLLAVGGFFTVIIFGLVTFFALRYRKGSKASRAGSKSDYLPIELAWTIIPLCIAFGLYVWASNLYADLRVAPKDAMNVYVIGKQWMWKIEHPQGQREINELHVPVGVPVKLIMTSQDVIHSFFIPAFRIKQDVIPGRYSTEWFQATKVGRYHFFCAQYCGTSHAQMGGTVVVMEKADYARWLSTGGAPATMQTTGDQLFQQFGCVTCHLADNTGRGPSLVGLFGKQVKLEGGGTVTADEDYVRESILVPTAKVVAGYKPIMPTFKGQVTPEQLTQLIEYVKSLSGPTVAAKGKKQ